MRFRLTAGWQHLPGLLRLCCCCFAVASGASGKDAHALASVTPLGRSVRFTKKAFLRLKLIPKTGSTFVQKMFLDVLPKQNFRLHHDVEALPHKYLNNSFVVTSMRNPCDLYVSIAHYGGAPGHVARPWFPKWYGLNETVHANPVPEYTTYDRKLYTPASVTTIRHNIPVQMLEDYVMAAQRKASQVGFYSFLFWEQIVRPECHYQQFVGKDGAYKWPGDTTLTEKWEFCYGDTNRRRPALDLFRWKPGDSAHCWLFQETLMANIRECLEAYEASSPLHAGVVNWTHFEAVEQGAVVQLSDKSKNQAGASFRHGKCDKYNPGLGAAVRVYPPHFSGRAI